MNHSERPTAASACLSLSAWQKVAMIGLPPIAALLVTLIRYPTPNSHGFEALGQAIVRCAQTFRNAGWLGAALYFFNYFSICGIVVVLSLFVARWWDTRRVIAFWIVSTSCILLFISPRFVVPYQVMKHYPAAQWPHGNVDHWTTFVVGYDPRLMPAAIAAGWVASLPFKPGKRYWLSRGMCPKCQYDLKGDSSNGCPECGWNRPPPKTSDAVSLRP